MTSIIEKRLSLHKNLENQKVKNDILKMQVGQLQALANIGTTTCMIAHEINNLLTPLLNYAEIAQQYSDDRALTERALQKTVKNSRRASKIMKSILAVANGETQCKQKTKLRNLVDEIFDCLCRDFSKDAISVNVEIPKKLTVWVIPVQIQQVLMNLILNARDAMLSKGGTLTICAKESDESINIEIRDTGAGIEIDNLDRIFDLFFTTKTTADSSQNSGSGIGLSFCKKVIEDHNGSITVESELGVGTVFKITIPNLQQGEDK